MSGLLTACHTRTVAKRVTCPSFVGREAELRRLEEVAEAALKQSQVVLLGGDAGVGKTRLIEEVCLRWRARGGRAAVGGCVDLGEVGAGYAPLIEVLRRLRTDLGSALLDGMVQDTAPELLPLLTGGHLGHPVLQGAVLARTLALVEELGDRYPGLILVFEDVHWADASTRDLVVFLARYLRTAKVALLVSYRADDIHRRHPLRPLLAELIRSPAVEHLQLGGMTRSELTVLLAGVGGAVPSDAVVDEVMARSEGVPFYAEELVASRTGSEPLPPTLRDAILVRIARLADPVQDMLRKAALLGAHIDERLLAIVSGRPVAEVGEALREAAAHQFLVADPDGCRFRHALVREALHDDLLPGERHRLHGATAAAIDAQPDLGGDADHIRWAQLAHHWGAAQDQPHAFAASVRAGVAAEEVGALANAAVHYQQAVDLWSRVPDPEVAAGMTRTELLVRAADVVHHAGSPALAARMVESALDLLGDGAEPETRAVVLERLGHHRWAACDGVGSGRAREEAVALVAGRPPSEAQALSLAALGRHQMLTDRYVEAESTLRRALAVAADSGSEAARTSALSGLGVTLAKLGRVDEGVDASRQSLEIARQWGTADDIGRAYVNLTATLIAATRCEEAAEMALTGLDHARRAGMLASDGVLLGYNRAEALYWLGRWDEAAALVSTDGDADRGRPHGSSGAVIAARIAFCRGESEGAERQRDRALAAAGTSSDLTPQALLCAAQIAGRNGRFDDARRHCAEAWDVLGASEDAFLAAQVCSVTLEIEADRVEAARMRGLRGEAEAGEAQAVADEWLGRARRMVAGLKEGGVRLWRDATAQLTFAEAEHERAWGRADPERWEAVAAHWEDLAFPYPAAVARYRQADALLRRRANRERAAAAARTALATAERMGAAPLAQQVRLLAQRGRLDLAEAAEPDPPAATDPFTGLGISRREGEVLALLAVGRTNRQIAEELFISEKTASVHVTHLLRKLTVASRMEAAAVAQRAGIGS